MRVVIAEDSVLLREGLARLLADGGVEVVAQAGDGPGLVAAVEAYRPDLAVVDVRMPRATPTRACGPPWRSAARPRDRHPGCPSTSRSATPATCSPAAPRASATCSRTGSPTSASSWPPSAGSATAAPPSTPRSWPSSSAAAAPPTLVTLSPRELDVLSLMAEGRSNAAIADRLVVTEGAVEKHISSIFTKLGLPPPPPTTAGSWPCSRSCEPRSEVGEDPVEGPGHGEGSRASASSRA